jgi:hypothetical protein
VRGKPVATICFLRDRRPASRAKRVGRTPGSPVGPLSMKGAVVVKVMVVGVGCGFERCSSLYRLLVGGKGGGMLRSGGAIPCGPSGQGARGACRSKGLVAGEHVPDCVGEGPGELDPGDLSAALFAEPGLCAFVAGFVERVAAGVVGRLDQGPVQEAGGLVW